ncbi:MAG: hypothetical protein IKM06_07075, partial [Clostridia bacterium]|nr:hypothetical protein [Clostridia bacterium]
MKKIISFILTLTLVLTAVGVYFVSVGAAAANTITGATLKLGASLALDFYADAEENTSMRFTTPTGASTVVKGVYDEKNTRYVYTYEGINPQCMADVITAELLSESGSVLATYENYSVKAYCDNMNKKSASELGINSVQYNALKNLLADLLVYGGEAQKYKQYNTEDLASDLDWVEENKTAFTVPTGVRGATGNADINNKVTAVSLYMGNVNKVYFRLKLNNDKIQLTLNDKLIDRSALEEDDGTYILYSD